MIILNEYSNIRQKAVGSCVRERGSHLFPHKELFTASLAVVCKDPILTCALEDPEEAWEGE